MDVPSAVAGQAPGEGAAGADFLGLLAQAAPREAYDEVVARAVAAGVSSSELEALRDRREAALRIHEQLERHRQREAELSALYETASDLTAIRDVDTILTAIVRRARQLLGADMTYLSLNDEAEGASYMKVTDGALTPEFRDLRLPLGTGLLGLVAQTGAPYFTEDYQSDERFVHRDYIDTAVAGEQIRAILGVPLIVDGAVIGALLAVHRTVRRFPPGEISLLMSFAAHAAVALQNARLFASTQEALSALDTAHQQVRAHSEAVEQAAHAHDELTRVLLGGGGVAEVAGVLADVLGGQVTVYDDQLRVVTGTGSSRPLAGSVQSLASAVDEAARSGHSVELGADGGGAGYVAVARAGNEHLGTLLLTDLDAPLDLAERRTLERGALVTALVLLFSRTVAEAEDRVRGELLADLVAGDEADERRLRERARRQGADLDGPTAVVVGQVGEAERDRAVKLAARVAAEHGGLAGTHAGHVVLVVPGKDPLEAGERLRERLRTSGVAATVGVAGTDHGVPGVAAAYPDAQRCLTTLLTLGRVGEVSDAAGLGVARLLLGDNGPRAVEEFLARTLGPLLDYDERRGTDLVGTLDAWYAAGERQAETAKRLHVHPNTVVQRLDRVDRLVGAGWREPARGLDLRLALSLLRLKGGDLPH